MVQAFEVNFDGFSTEFGKSLDYLHYLCFTFSSTLAKQSSPLSLIENELKSSRFLFSFSASSLQLNATSSLLLKAHSQ